MRKLCNIRLLIFDLDGTLIDSAEDIALHVGRVYRELKSKDVPADEVKKNIGDGARSLLANFFQGQELEEALERFLHYYISEPVIHTKPYEGVMETLEGLKERGILLAVATNKPHAITLEVLKRLKMFHYFDEVLGADLLPEKKPSPLPLLEIAKRLEVSPELGLMVGDSENDILAGRRAGMLTAHARWGYKAPQSPPDYHLDHPKDLLHLID
ncbi:HAD family hydrolase [Thermocrinis ruber]|uniref:HAD family hydrolase n=1 Tax=Thermocrinis ruber TaxID=75906 RepID=UPI00056E4E84|nr:HAD-IA family hydrolase [Thermocrinis ruber]